MAKVIKVVDKEIYSAYRFVPIEQDQGFFSPNQEWQDKISQDIPMKDGLSGKISFNIKAQTPLFIKGADGNFCQTEDGKYFIPATSMKGCIRSVLEIMSFGHLNQNRVENKNFVVRDLADKENYMDLMMGQVYCGWLSKDGTKISNWGEPIKIDYSEIDIENIKNLTAIEKYRNYKNPLKQKFSKYTKSFRNFKGDTIEQTWCRLGRGEFGHLFFSGAMIRKHSDFVLLESYENSQSLTVTSNIFQDFWNIYSFDINGQKKYFDRVLPFNSTKGGYPIFFTICQDENGDDFVNSIGLSYLHKFTACNSIYDAIPEELKKEKLDLADVIFGSKDSNFKGRVQFSRGKQVGDITPLMKDGNMIDSILTVLGSPQASFYPTYLQNRETWNSINDICISGFKRYPIKNEFDISRLMINDKNKISNGNAVVERFGDKQFHEFSYNRMPFLWKEVDGVSERRLENLKLIPRELDDNGNETRLNVESLVELKPINIDSEFSFEIKFHNLKKVELGALLSALTFHKNQDVCKHSLGMAKAYGYGSIKVFDIKLKIWEYSKFEDKIWEQYCDEFAVLMDSKMKEVLHQNIKWKDTDQVKGLIAMAKGIEKNSDVFTPLILSEFAKAKEQYLKNKTNFSTFIKTKEHGK